MIETYQDLAIKDGILVGRFEEMYQRFEDPWGQSNTRFTALSYSNNALLLALKRRGIRSVLEVGSGLGHLSNLIDRETKARVVGLEISETTVKKAKKNFPELEFFTGDATKLFNHSQAIEAFVFAEVTWFLLPGLKQLFQEMKERLSGRYFIQTLTFYGAERQQYGREFFSSPEEFIKFCPFQLQEY